MAPRRGDVWTVEGRAPRTVLVVSGDMFNDLPDHPYVLAMHVVAFDARDMSADVPAVVDIGQGHSAVVDTIGRVPKRLFSTRLRQVGVQALTDVDTWLFKILATN